MYLCCNSPARPTPSFTTRIRCRVIECKTCEVDCGNRAPNTQPREILAGCERVAEVSATHESWLGVKRGRKHPGSACAGIQVAAYAACRVAKSGRSYAQSGAVRAHDDGVPKQCAIITRRIVHGGSECTRKRARAGIDKYAPCRVEAIGGSRGAHGENACVCTQCNCKAETTLRAVAWRCQDSAFIARRRSRAI